jgi:hypothetical protein
MRQKTLCSWPVGFRISFCASFNPFRMTKMRKRKREREREKEREREHDKNEKIAPTSVENEFDSIC